MSASEPDTKPHGVSENDLEAARLHAEGQSYRQIGLIMNVSANTAMHRARRGRAAWSELPPNQPTDIPVAVRREMETKRLEGVITTLLIALNNEHPLVSNGRLFPELQDWGPRIAAARELRLCSESIRKLWGVDAPAVARVEVVTDDIISEEIERLSRQLVDRGEALPRVIDGVVEPPRELPG